MVADFLNVDRRKIMDIEKGNINVGLLLDYADLLDVEVNLQYKVH